jgi:peptidyl-dipeptidase A
MEDVNVILACSFTHEEIELFKTMTKKPLVLATALALSAGAAHAAEAPKKGKATAADAHKFIQATEEKFDKLGLDANRADWVAANFITDDTEALSAYFGELTLDAAGKAALEARRYNGLKLSEDDARKLKLLQLTLMLSDPKERAEYSAKKAALQGAYGKAKYCPTDGRPCMPLGELEKVLANSRDPKQLLDAWNGWHSQSPAYKKMYADYVDLSNKGAREMGYADTGALWRSQYDMTPEQFAAEMERLWQQVKPLYDSLHEYARYKLREAYGPDVVPLTGPIPAHLFGNMWSQTWDNIYPLLMPPTGASKFDLTKVLEERKTSAKEMVQYGERFYTSLGMQKLPDTFWQRSLLTKPQDRDVVCHASAWQLDGKDDVRIKMCIRPTAEEFTVIHHELGHIYYDLAYKNQSNLFRTGANDGFHEAIGDTVALSITPDYLMKVSLMAQAPDPAQDLGPMMHRALCREAGNTEPLNRCSIYGNKKAGAKFQAMLEMGASKPWPEALKAITGEDKIDGGALIDYFAPLKTWLDAQNKQLALADKNVKP